MLKNRWDIKETGDLRSFLGINIHYDREQGRLTFDVDEKIKKIFKEKEWLADIGHSRGRRKYPRIHATSLWYLLEPERT